MQVALRPHPLHPSPSVADVVVDVDHSAPGLLDLCYVVRADLERIAVPPAAEPARADNLWQTTCFELFLRPDGDSAYFEINFSPSGVWAAYSFRGYRKGMANVPLPSPPVISSLTRPWGVLETHVTLPLEAFGSGRCLLFHPAAVVEEIGVGRSFWAFAHPPGDPDFHDPACFMLQLPPPAQA